ncbi:MAG: PQQ-binding-like beta-propeller repeat protein [Acidobacteriota bacterium]
MHRSSSSDVASLPLRLWPGVAALILQWFARFALPLVWPDGAAVGVLTALACSLIILLWWVFLSRAPRIERWGGAALIVLVLAATPVLLHPSIATGMMGMMFLIYALPTVCLALVAWAVVADRLPQTPRRALFAVLIMLGAGGWAVTRTDGITGDARSSFAWRWSPTAEERLLAGDAEMPADAAAIDPSALAGSWPGFRGVDRSGVVPDLRIATDWARTPPTELWRQPVGPGWSSFAVRGGRAFTQEQRGDDELVTCYDAATGAVIWRFRDPTRFWESNAGAGPRATPTLHGDRVLAFGATGRLHAIDIDTGAALWSRDVAADAEVEVPTWGFASSPLVVGDAVVVHAGTLVAYDLGTGVPRWASDDAAIGRGYASPHRLVIDGVEQIVLLSFDGVTSVSPPDGRQLWHHAWSGVRIVQPVVIGDGELLIGTQQEGTRRLTVARDDAGDWQVEAAWTSNRLKPYFNDFVVHNGHAYGFDGRILACIDVADGARCWKGGRYGHGQLMLLADQGLLLVTTEKGELALVDASPEGFVERARMPAIAGKTWNQPALAGDVLLVRNAEEMAAFRLPAGDGDASIARDESMASTEPSDAAAR